MVSVSGEAVFERIERTRQLISELEPILQSLMMNDSTMIDGLAQMLGTLQHMQQRTEAHIANLAADLRELGTNLQRANGTAQAPAAGRVAFDPDDPEISLLAHLLPYLPNPVTIDVGANIGRVAQRLVAAGFEVFAFEPFPASYASLAQEAERQADRLHPFPYAIGAEDCEAKLLVAADSSGEGKWDTSLFHSTVRHPMLEDLTFAAAVTVTSRSLSSLMAAGGIPADAAVLKIDTEGADLEVMQGAGAAVFAAVLMEFWDANHPFGRAGHGELGRSVQQMRARGYYWHIVIYRVDETGALGYYCNARSTVPQSWGNAVFFRDFALFSQAAAWCAKALPAG